MVRIGIVAGEHSGDLLGSGLLQELKKNLPKLEMRGICGPLMQAQGCQQMYAMERISVMGLDGLAEKLFDIVKIRKSLVDHFSADPPDLFIGIDVPDFNVSLEYKLRRRGIPVMHYVSPTVWAWRGYRIHKISRAVDHMLTLFPFEANYYRKHNVPVSFVGHPMADEIGPPVTLDVARTRVGLDPHKPLIAILPGSRMSEIRRLGSLFIRTANWLLKRNPELHFIAPFVDERSETYFKVLLAAEGQDLPITTQVGQSHQAMAAADVVMLASGTAALEAALLRRPMVVAYRISWLSYLLVRWFAHVDFYAMPNHLAGRQVVPELMQANAEPEKIGHAVERYFKDDVVVAEAQQAFAHMHSELKRGAHGRAAAVVCELLRVRVGNGI
ncbi:MAG TPA: lipid-A-disaccharide synthase [Acidiferrobacteraceae bacterium]|nr:lipid-A-disaccharide synthase [Acidiferrobacteraceae bacterium]